MVRSDGNGSFVIKKAYGIIAFILLVVTTTISAVMAVGVRPVKDRVCDIERNDKLQDEKLHQLDKIVDRNIAVRDEQYKNMMEKLDTIQKSINQK